jgi:hypothetical protein
MARFPAKTGLGKNHKFRGYWKNPWGRKAQRSPAFKKFCWEHGFVSPNFTRAEWASKDGTAVPESLRKNAQRQAFKCERLRHALGDKPISGLSYYRSPAHNAAVGGASQSRHMSADATDWPASMVDAKFRQEAERIWKQNGIGSYPGGSVHTDARPWYARWTSW